ncbi:MAG: hypothetical protein ONB16_10010 [candidate division KSB1 bacterium]|nr:hypothetical protein [candidate division KSB1 bacterium]MDZ7318176.1 hypothetical protein [candidate division KSB1 bacterium]MDZ7340678.1 hypothetical protein [candidate division KSB1 bacterium]
MKKNNDRTVFEKDLILVYIENRPAFFARIEKITPDHKRGWWRLQLLVLQVPLLVTTWILDEEQIRGADFTMGGTPVRIEKVIPPAELAVPEPVEETSAPSSQADKGPARILTLNRDQKK